MLKSVIIFIFFSAFFQNFLCAQEGTKTSDSDSVKNIVPDELKSQLSDSAVIKFRYFFGECLGNCSAYVLVTSKKILIHKDDDFGFKGDFEKEIPIDPKMWNKLIQTVDFRKFFDMNEEYGCPDCDDGGGEWVSIRDQGYYKRVTFDYGSELEEITEFVWALR